VSLLWTPPTVLYLSCAEGSRVGCRTSGEVSPEQSGEAGSPSLDPLDMLLLM